MLFGQRPDREQSPIEWRDFPFVRSFAPPPPPLAAPNTSQPGLRPSQPGPVSQASGPASQASGPASQASSSASQSSGLASQVSGPTSQASRPASQPQAQPARPLAQSARPSQPGLWPSQPASQEGRTDGKTDKWKISPFYRTSSPIGAAALLLSMKSKEELNAKTSWATVLFLAV